MCPINLFFADVCLRTLKTRKWFFASVFSSVDSLPCTWLIMYTAVNCSFSSSSTEGPMKLCSTNMLAQRWKTLRWEKAERSMGRQEDLAPGFEANHLSISARTSSLLPPACSTTVASPPWTPRLLHAPLRSMPFHQSLIFDWSKAVRIFSYCHTAHALTVPPAPTFPGLTRSHLKSFLHIISYPARPGDLKLESFISRQITPAQ